jgi:hypothetical protein
MLRKEWRDLFRQSLVFMAAAALMPGFVLLFGIVHGPYWDVFFPLFQCGLLFWVLFLGASFLMPERMQRSEIYLLSLPYSKFRLLSIKLLPRIVGAAAFMGLHASAFLSWGENSAALSFISFNLIYLALFCIALSVSLSSENFLVLFFLSLFGLMAYLGLLFLVVRVDLLLKDYYLFEPELYTFFNGELDEASLRLLPWTALILLSPLVIAFAWAFRKWDARPAQVHNLRFIKALVPLGSAAVIAALLFLNLTFRPGFRIFYLTQDRQLVENHAYSGLRIYDGQDVHKIRELGDYCWGFSDFEGVAFCMTQRGIGRIDLGDYSQEFIYELLPGREIEGGYRYFDGCLAFFTNRRTGTDRQFEVLDVSTGDLQIVEWELEGFSLNVWPRLFAADTQAGERFWLFHLRDEERQQHVYRIWEDGRYEHVAESSYFPIYVNRMLLTYTEGRIELLQIEEGGSRVVETIPNPDGFRFGGGWFRDLERGPEPVAEIYGIRMVRGPDQRPDLRYAFLDLEEFVIRPAEDMLTSPTKFGGEEHFLIERPERDSRELNIYSLEKGVPTFLKTLARIDRQKTRFNLEIGKTGLVIEKGRSVLVYSVPALEELRFRKLR